MIATALLAAVERPWAALLLLVALYGCLYTLHRLILHPLRRVPGPLHRRLLPFASWFSLWVRQEAIVVHRLHQRYGPVVLTAPNTIDISDPDGIQAVYVDKGGLKKASFYRNFDLDGHATIFSTDNLVNRTARAKAVAPLLALSAVRGETGPRGSIGSCVADFVAMLEAARQDAMPSGDAIDLLDVTRRFSNDAVTGYLNGRRMGALVTTTNGKLSQGLPNDEAPVTGFLDDFVAVGRIYRLPPWLFHILSKAQDLLVPSKREADAIVHVQGFTRRMVEDAADGKSLALKDTYQGRLLAAGISQSEARAQCADVIFAGTDSTAATLSVGLWHLAKSPETVKRLRADLAAGSARYLAAVTREALRLGLAVPAQLPRVVKDSFEYQGYVLPPGTVVGCSAYSVHLGSVFDEPHEFRPERWLDESLPMFAFGAGVRQCIARNLATEMLCAAFRGVAEANVLDGAEAVGARIAILDSFNARFVDKVQLRFKEMP